MKHLVVRRGGSELQVYAALNRGKERPLKAGLQTDPPRSVIVRSVVTSSRWFARLCPAGPPELHGPEQCKRGEPHPREFTRDHFQPARTEKIATEGRDIDRTERKEVTRVIERREESNAQATVG